MHCIVKVCPLIVELAEGLGPEAIGGCVPTVERTKTELA